MATILFPKQGSTVRLKVPQNGVTEYTYQGFRYDRLRPQFVVTPLGQPVRNYNYTSFSASLFEDIAEDQKTPFLDSNGLPFQDDCYYTDNEGNEVRVFSQYIDYIGDNPIYYAATLKKGLRVKTRYQLMNIEDLTKVEAKKKLTKAQAAAMTARQEALEYVFKMCVGLEYDASRLTEEQVDSFVSMYYAQGKMAVNNALMSHFDNLPKLEVDFSETIKNALTFSDKFNGVADKFAKQIEERVHAAKYYLNDIDNNIKYFKRDVDAYQKRIDQLNKDIQDYDVNKRKKWTDELEKCDQEMAAHQAELAKTGQGDRATKIAKIMDNLNSTIKKIVENTGGFYKFEKIVCDYNPIETADQLETLKVVFVTNKVYGRDPRVKGLCFDAGQFRFDWKPFYPSFNSGRKEYDKDLRPGTPAISVWPHKDNTIIDGYPHPHIQKGGYVCWGETADHAITRQMQYNSEYEHTGDCSQMFNKLKALLHSYNANSPYKRLVEFAVKKHPELADQLETEFKPAATTVLYNPEKKGITNSELIKMSKAFYEKVHDVTVTNIRDERENTLPPTERKKGNYLVCKTYMKRIVGVDDYIAVPTGERNKRYIKLADNQFVEVKDDKTFGKEA